MRGIAALVCVGLLLPALSAWSQPAGRGGPVVERMGEGRQGSRARMAGRGAVQVRDQRLMVGRQEIPLLCGEVHYWRLDPANWRTVLHALRDAGLTMVGTYVPWRIHEAQQGVFNFGDAQHPELDLAAFLGLCRELELFVFLRPGPLIVSEMTHGGLPDWLFDDPSILTHDAQDKVATFGAFADKGSPTYLHPEYLRIARGWLTAVNDVVRPYLHTNGGPVVMVQLDNEISMICLDSYLTSDYNPAVVGPGGLFHQWLKKKYGSADNLPYKDAVDTIEAVEPPRELPERIDDDLFRYFDWVEFKEDFMADYVAALRDIHREDGLRDELFTVNFNPHRPLDVPNNWHKQEAATGGGISGFDYYKRPFLTHEGFMKTALGVRYSNAVTKLPWSPEWMCGIWGEDFGNDGMVGPEHTEFLYLVGLAYGLVGFNHYMFAERESWSFSAVNEFGQRRYNWEALRRMTALHKELDPPGLAIDGNVGLWHDRRYAWLVYIEDDFACRDDQVQLGTRFVDGTRNGETAREYEGLFNLLLQLGHAPTIIAPEVNLREAYNLKALVVPCQERMDRDLLRELYSLSLKGTRVIFVPHVPTLDWSGAPLNMPVPARADVVESGSRFAQRTYEEEQRLKEQAPRQGFISPFGAETDEQRETLRELLGKHATPSIHTGDPFMPAILHTRRRERYVFVMNLHTRAREVTLSIPFRAVALEDMLTRERFAVHEGEALMSVDSKQGRVLKVVD